MFIKELSLVNFKNYENTEIEFSSKINCFVGKNGSGKTNMLDAIHYLCMCKSCFNTVDNDTIKASNNFAIVQGNFYNESNKYEIYCGIQQNKRKIFKKDKKEYTKMADHIGLIPLVMISPEDIKLIIDGGEERRKYINSVISQYDKVYLNSLINYNKILEQRNRVLKELFSKPSLEDTIPIYNEQMAEQAEYIHKARKSFTDKLLPIFQKYYDIISDKNEKVELIFESQLNNYDFRKLLEDNLSRDKVIQYTSVGPHKDDIKLYLLGRNIKRIGSQGQQKTFLVSLKLAQFDFIYEICNKKPILLLDDIFDKFDEQRVEQIINIVSSEKFGQIFISHTNSDKLAEILDKIPVESKIFNVDNGHITYDSTK